MPFLFKIARKSAWILVAAMIVALFSGVMLVRYQLFSGISYSLITGYSCVLHTDSADTCFLSAHSWGHNDAP